MYSGVHCKHIHYKKVAENNFNMATQHGQLQHCLMQNHGLSSLNSLIVLVILTLLHY